MDRLPAAGVQLLPPAEAGLSTCCLSPRVRKDCSPQGVPVAPARHAPMGGSGFTPQLWGGGALRRVPRRLSEGRSKAEPRQPEL